MGAQAFNNLDTYLAPFIKYDNLDYNEVLRQMQSFIFNINNTSRWGGQSPFSNISFDLKCPEDMKNQPVIIGGKQHESWTYGMFQNEMNMINKAFAETMLYGDRDGNIHSFPIPTYNVTTETDWDSEVMQTILKLTAKYGSPYFQNFIGSGLDPKMIRSMCCRLSLDVSDMDRNVGGLFGSGDLTGCYDEKTRVMTQDGFKYFKDITFMDRICTRNPETKEIEYHAPKEIFEYDYSGDLIRFENDRGFKSPLVTPNHRMYIEVEKTDGVFEPTFKEAREDFNHTKWQIPKNGIWKGDKQDKMHLSELIVICYRNDSTTGYEHKIRKSRTIPAVTYDMKAFCKFIGIWIGDGSIQRGSHGGYGIFLTHGNNERKMEYYKQVLEELGVKFNTTSHDNTYVVFNMQLFDYLKRYCKSGAHNKQIPHNLLSLDKEYLDALWEGLLNSDGSIGVKGALTYYTCSKELADNVLELFYKIGYGGRIRSREPRIATLKDGREIIGRRTAYEVSLQTSERMYCSSLTKTYHPYCGKVYCCEVPNHVMLVERDGQTMWCGNSINVTTLNLPKYAYLSDNQEEFFNMIKKYADLAYVVSERKRVFLNHELEIGKFPWTKIYLPMGYNNHFSTIGVIGGHEACLNFGIDSTSEEGIKFLQRILFTLRDLCKEYKAKSGNRYNVEATPGEGTTYRLAKIDASMYGIENIAHSGSNENPYYTNSTQLPVDYSADVFLALKHQNQLQPLYTGGTVFHTFIGEKITDTEALKNFIVKTMTNTALPYVSVSPTFSVCEDCGYHAGEHFQCPTCGKESEVFSRVVGYYRPVQRWNPAKQEEYKDRITFTNCMSE